MTEVATFKLNGVVQPLHSGDPTESLLRWLKRHRLTGTKEGCGDGDCGACTVALIETDAMGQARFQAVNSCLLPIGILPGREVLTVEALEAATTSTTSRPALHAAQQAMVDCAGSQCGYCTPGFVMSLFVAQQNGCVDDAAVEGNLCRCTGYRSIRAAAAQLAVLPAAEDGLRALLTEPRARLASAALGSCFSPSTIEEAFAVKAQWPDAVWIAGATDLGVDFSRARGAASAYIALDRLAELQMLEIGSEVVRVGAGLSLSRIERALVGLFPALDQMLPWFAARQVRNRATLGGNLGTASPIGDLLPVLLALDATVHLRGPQGARDLPIADFFLDYRKTARTDVELILAVTLPRRSGQMNASYKVAKRTTDDISIVAAAFALELDAQQRVSHARLAYGGVAATPRRALRSEALLLDHRLDPTRVAQAAAALCEEFTPLSDHRASAEYRRALCGSLFEKFVAERIACSG